jgi:hypothetical protein
MEQKMIFFFLACFEPKTTTDTSDTGSSDSGVWDTGMNDTESVDTSSQDSGESIEVQSNACHSDEDCGGSGQCISVVDVNEDVRVCRYPVDVWMYECTEFSWGCCSDEECDGGFCAAMEIDYCGGAAPEEENICVSQGCVLDSDCGEGTVCLDGGVLGSSTGTCIPAFCTQNSDCDGIDGRCSLVYDGVTCPSMLLTCTDRESTCHWYGDCTQGLCVGTEQGVSCQEELPPS